MKALDAYLATRSYLTGYTATSDDVACFTVVASSPDAKKFVNAFRWYKHVAAFTDAERKAFPAGRDEITITTAAAAAPASPAKASPAKPAAAAKEEEEEDDDLFGSDTEEDRIREEARKAKVAAARAGKPEKEKPKQRSLIVFELKPMEAETDLNAIATKIKAIEHKGIQNWGAEHKLLPVAYGINKLAISAVVWDDDITVDDFEEMFMSMFPDDIQSVDVAAMSKV